MQKLYVYMNNYLVGFYVQHASGVNEFQYADAWLSTLGARPISLSIPLQQAPFTGALVNNFFNNLLPDNEVVLDRIVARYQLNSRQTFHLIEAIGKDSVGALSFYPEHPSHQQMIQNSRQMDYEVLSESKLERILLGYQEQAPLGMLPELEDFRISIAGAQEKTALLKVGQSWCLPLGNTPTSHIIKLPIGHIQTHAHRLDLSHSAENEFLCLALAHKFGFKVPRCEIIRVGQTKALGVERFDRKYSTDQSWLMRLPQEDYCQIFGLPAARKYESDGGPNIAMIMKHLQGSTVAIEDGETFMRSQILFFLLGAIDGHAKNFSVFIEPNGAYRLTPLYDILSAYPLVKRSGLHLRDLKLAMSLQGSRGKKWHIHQIFRRHFLATARQVQFNEIKMNELINEMCQQVEDVISSVLSELPQDFPSFVADSIFNGMRQRKERLLIQ